MPLQLVLLLLVLVLVSGEDWEHELVQYPSPARLRAHLEHLTRFPHPAGSPGARKAAQYVAKQFDRAGLPTHIIQFNALISNPVSAKLTLLQDNIRAKLAEEIVQQDHTSDTWYRNHSYHAYSPSALVKAPLVYVNYGLEQDFGELEKRGIPLQGKIAIVKYGRSFRGLKVLNAQKRGMLGMLIYSDPKDDGYVRGATYPDGSWRPKSGIQRGNVQFASRCSGDPGFIERDPDICGYASEDLMPKIPSMPISYEDAKPLLASLGGDNSPPEWHGGLDVPYNIGPGPGVVEMEVNNTREVAKLWNVVVKIPGKDFPDEEIILGNHRDAWVYGAVDPNSGTSALIELAKAFGHLLRKGWRPSRTIVLCSWDGEEHGLLGSTNFGETFAKSLAKNAVAYFNVDSAVAGSKFTVSATPSLIPFLENVARNVSDPTGNTSSLYEYWSKDVYVLGSGSDYAVFLHHLGIASVDLSFSGNDKYGVYHSIYDSFDWMERFGDPDFKFHQSMTQYWGLAAFRMASAKILPFDFSAYATKLLDYYGMLKQATLSSHLELNLDSLKSAIDTFASAAEYMNARISALSESSDTASIRLLNRQLYLAERLFLSDEGLVSRRWFKHVVQAPGLDTGYGAVVFPGVWDTVSRGDLDGATSALQILNTRMLHISEYLRATQQ